MGVPLDTMTIIETVGFFGVIALGTFMLRAIPFVIFPENRPTPPYVQFLGKVLPYSIIGMLVVYCLRSVSLAAFPFALPEGLSILAIVILQLKVKNMLLSIGGGTVIYMILIQTIFSH